MLSMKSVSTVDEFCELLPTVKEEDKRLELINGTVKELELDKLQRTVTKRLLNLLTVHVRKHKLGHVTDTMGFGRVRDTQNMRIPDLAFISFERTLPISKQMNYTPYMPDLAILVKPASATANDIGQRAIYFLQNGAELVWMVHPDSKSVDVLMRPGVRHFRVLKVKSGETLSGGTTIPGFSLDVDLIFA